MSFKAKDGRPNRGFLHGRSPLVKLALFAIPVAGLATVIGLGCANGSDKKTPPTTGSSASALDVGPSTGTGTGGTALTSTPTYAPTYTPPPAAAPATPVADAYPTAPVADVGAASGANRSAARSYTVQKGDTLIKIARTQYGDEHKWKQIAAANPGVNANSIKVGQKINLP
jgi:nucleoid-associated protein YgaU